MPLEILLGRSHALPSGLRVRLRLAQSRDLRPIQALLRSAGAADDQFEAPLLVRFDPRRRVVICAMALIGGAETIVGVGAIEVGASTPEVLLVEQSLGDGLPDLLTRALRSRVEAISHRQAA